MKWERLLINDTSILNKIYLQWLFRSERNQKLWGKKKKDQKVVNEIKAPWRIMFLAGKKNSESLSAEGTLWGVMVFQQKNPGQGTQEWTEGAMVLNKENETQIMLSLQGRKNYLQIMHQKNTEYNLRINTHGGTVDTILDKSRWGCLEQQQSL